MFVTHDTSTIINYMCVYKQTACVCGCVCVYSVYIYTHTHTHTHACMFMHGVKVISDGQCTVYMNINEYTAGGNAVLPVKKGTYFTTRWDG